MLRADDHDPDQVLCGATMVELRLGDLSAQPDLDAVVNAANAQLTTGGGVAGALHRAAGPGLAAAAVPLGPIAPGQCVLTAAHGLPNTAVLHALGPVYGRDRPAAGLLAETYRSCLHVADRHELATVGFPALSTGAFGFPMGPAAEIALATVVDVLPTLGHVRLIRFVLADEDALQAHRNALAAAVAE
ncbi:MAG: macro domain-containing protein [Nitriliruptoraceae bacterium]|nr:macro domain-containing protein [Nitriliruptoraceae bacterium]